MPLWIGLRSGVLSHRSPWVRTAPWLLLLAVVFGLAFLPLMVFPEVDRWLALRDQVATAEQAAEDAEMTARSLAQLSEKVPGLASEVAAKERRLVALGGLPGVVTRLAQQAASAGAVLDGVTFGPYQPILPPGAPGAGQGAATPGAGGSTDVQEGGHGTEAGASAPGGGTGTGETGGPPPSPTVATGTPEETPYGRITVDIGATGSWDALAALAGRVVADPGIRVRSWSVTGDNDGRYHLQIQGDLLVKGRPPIDQGTPVSLDELGAGAGAHGEPSTGGSAGGGSS